MLINDHLGKEALEELKAALLDVHSKWAGSPSMSSYSVDERDAGSDVSDICARYFLEDCESWIYSKESPYSLAG